VRLLCSLWRRMVLRLWFVRVLQYSFCFWYLSGAAEGALVDVVLSVPVVVPAAVEARLLPRDQRRSRDEVCTRMTLCSLCFGGG
jgi:hypothetical protein